MFRRCHPEQELPRLVGQLPNVLLDGQEQLDDLCHREEGNAAQGAIGGGWDEGKEASGGAQFAAPKLHLRANVTYADPLDKTFSTATKKPPSRVLVQVIFAY